MPPIAKCELARGGLPYVKKMLPIQPICYFKTVQEISTITPQWGVRIR
jgi:hypothetical protein